MRTRTGELTVHVDALTFLAKAMLALPDKYHGLEDMELRYRQRYLDLFIEHRASREVFVKRPQRCLRAHPRVLRRARLPRSRDADDAHHRGRRGGAALHHPPQHAGHGRSSCASRRSSI